MDCSFWGQAAQQPQRLNLMVSAQLPGEGEVKSSVPRQGDVAQRQGDTEKGRVGG